MGALTIKPLAFQARPWELNNIEVINFFDNYCGKIAIQKRGEEIMRILPSRKEEYYWITDKMRFFFQGLKKQRIMYPYIYAKTKYIKINWSLSILFIKYIELCLNVIDNINKIDITLGNKKYQIYKNIFINKNENKGDLISNYILKNICNQRNITKYEQGNYKGNINQIFFSEKILQQIKNTKYNILNNINIINDYPRIWSLIKNNKILIIGAKKSLKIKNIIINNTNTETNKINKLKSIIGIIKEKLIIYTEKEINNKYQEIILNKNTENFNKIWINNVIKNFSIEKNTIKYNFLLNNNQEKNTGINITFLTHGIEKLFGYHLILPITTFLEEYSLRLTAYGKIAKSIPVSIRSINMRNLAQILLFINQLIIKQEKNNNLLELKLIKEILLLKYGIISTEDQNQTEFLKLTKNRENKAIKINREKEEDLIKNTEILKIKESFSKKKNNY